MSKPKRPEAGTQALRALAEIRERVVSGAFPRGMRLLEEHLAWELLVSRTPIREALGRLVEERLIERPPAERGLQEADAARLRAVVSEFDSCFRDSLLDVDFERYPDLNATLHEEFGRICGSSLLASELERARGLPFASPSAFILDNTRTETFRRTLHAAQDQHRSLVEAIIGGEGARAEALAREHARTGTRNFRQLIKNSGSSALDLPGLAIPSD